jgi:dihydrofolate reductase
LAKLTITTFLSLDGIMQAPGGPAEDTSGGFAHGGWLVPYVDQQFGEFIIGVFSRPTAFLLGRGTYEIFAAWWPTHNTPGDPVATALNNLPKYVASRSLEQVTWAGSTLIRDVGADVIRLKQELAGELQVHGSPGLAQTLFKADLVDEINLLTFPVILGGGKRLFEAGVLPSAFELAQSHATGKGLVISTYRRVGRPTYGSVGWEIGGHHMH